MKMVVIATNNKNKVREFKSILNTNKIEFKTLSEIGYDKDIVEDGKSFKENAIIKARTIALELNTIAISDDSGLECLGLNNEPGIYSARYAGTHNDDDNNKLLIKNLQNVSDRRARYVCAICLYHPNGDYRVVEGVVDGEIIDTPRGENGFGYDPIFYYPPLHKTSAMMTLEEKNKYSHRAKALKKLYAILKEL